MYYRSYTANAQPRRELIDVNMVIKNSLAHTRDSAFHGNFFYSKINKIAGYKQLAYQLKSYLTLVK